MISAHRLPNLLVLGASKSGTTYVHHELGRHPDIFMSGVKEPSFFSDSFQKVGDPVSYVDLFADAGGSRWVGESSHLYLSHPESAGTIRAFLDPERFILILRDPVERALAQYRHMSLHGRELAGSFERGLAVEDRRMRSARLRRSRRIYFLNYAYVGSSRYGEQLARYFELFDRDRFTILFFEDLRRDPAAMIRQLLDVLDVEQPESVDPQTRNAGGRQARVPALSVALRSMAEAVGPPLGPRIRSLIYQVARPADEMRAATRLELQERLRPDVELLEQLTGTPVPWMWFRQRDERRTPTGRRCQPVRPWMAHRLLQDRTGPAVFPGS